MDEIVNRAVALLAAGHPLPPELRVELDQVFASVRPTVVQVCRCLLPDPEVGEEIAQDAIGEAWRKLAEFRDEGTFKSWVCGFARNLCNNRRRKWTDVLTDDGDIDWESPALDALAALRQSERDEVFELALGQLPRLQQDALRLSSLGWSYAAIDRELGLVGSGARNELAKARRGLTHALRDELDRRGHSSSFFWTTVS